jgi:hypothetical protein
MYLGLHILLFSVIVTSVEAFVSTGNYCVKAVSEEICGIKCMQPMYCSCSTRLTERPRFLSINERVNAVATRWPD